MTMEEIKKIHIEKYKGHFFDEDTMRFFDSRILPEVYEGYGGIYFITSEKFHTDPRNYTVRRFFPDTGEIQTIKKFNKLTLIEAQMYAGKLSEGRAS